MVDQSFTRRASYGPSSPTVGTRGARTRQQIADAALHCFTDKGFHATAVEDIAALAETSRATLYQYFESKEAIFVELMHECGGALHRVTRRLGHLGPTAEGYDNLHWWLGEWAWVFDRYAAMFIEWANVNSPKAPLRATLAEFVNIHIDNLVVRVRAAGYSGDDPTAAALMTLAVTSRYNYIRHVYRPGLSDAALLESLATGLQLFLFPETPEPVLIAGPHSADRLVHVDHERPPIANIGPLATLPPHDTIPRADPFDGLSPQANRTVRLLLDASGRVFAASGFDAANIDQIVTEAGLARGTFYRYFSDKLELITTLAGEAASVMTPLFDQFAQLAVEGDAARLRSWLGEFLAAQRQYAGVLRAWTEGLPIDPALLAPAADVVAAMSRAVAVAFGPNRPYPLDRRAVGLMLAGVLEYFPNEGAGSRHEPSDDAIIETQAQWIERVLLSRPSNGEVTPRQRGR